MSFLGLKKDPIYGIDYDYNPTDWEASNNSTVAKLSLERMKYKNQSDSKKQQQIREKSWYLDIPYFNKGIVNDKVVDVGDVVKGRFYGKDPASAKAMFETFFSMIKKQETEKLQKQMKEKKVKQVIKATETAQAIVQEENPVSPDHDITHALTEGETNPVTTNVTPSRTVNMNHSEEEKERQAKGATQRLTSALGQQNPMRDQTQSTQSRNQASEQQKKTMGSYAPSSLSRFRPKTKKASTPQTPSGGKRNNVTKKRSQNIIMKV